MHMKPIIVVIVAIAPYICIPSRFPMKSVACEMAFSMHVHMRRSHIQMQFG